MFTLFNIYSIYKCTHLLHCVYNVYTAQHLFTVHVLWLWTHFLSNGCILIQNFLCTLYSTFVSWIFVVIEYVCLVKHILFYSYIMYCVYVTWMMYTVVYYRSDRVITEGCVRTAASAPPGRTGPRAARVWDPGSGPHAKHVSTCYLSLDGTSGCTCVGPWVGASCQTREYMLLIIGRDLGLHVCGTLGRGLMPNTWVHVTYTGSGPHAKHVSTCYLYWVRASCQTREYMLLILGWGLMPNTWVRVTYPGSGPHAKHVSTCNLTLGRSLMPNTWVHVT